MSHIVPSLLTSRYAVFSNAIDTRTALQRDKGHLQSQPSFGIGHRAVMRFEGSLRHGERRMLAVHRLLRSAYAVL